MFKFLTGSLLKLLLAVMLIAASVALIGVGLCSVVGAVQGESMVLTIGAVICSGLVGVVMLCLSGLKYLARHWMPGEPECADVNNKAHDHACVSEVKHRSDLWDKE
jgi:hypothetical protein